MSKDTSQLDDTPIETVNVKDFNSFNQAFRYAKRVGAKLITDTVKNYIDREADKVSKKEYADVRRLAARLGLPISGRRIPTVTKEFSYVV